MFGRQLHHIPSCAVVFVAAHPTGSFVGVDERERRVVMGSYAMISI